ncbi:transposase [Streptococcus suis]|nr:transposase [Streptococcus suis]
MSSEEISDGRKYSLLFLYDKVEVSCLKDKDKVLNALELPYFNAKLEATNNLIKVIKRNAFGFRNFENFKKRLYKTVVAKSTVEIMEPF